MSRELLHFVQFPLWVNKRSHHRVSIAHRCTNSAISYCNFISLLHIHYLLGQASTSLLNDSNCVKRRKVNGKDKVLSILWVQHLKNSVHSFSFFFFFLRIKLGSFTSDLSHISHFLNAPNSFIG